LSAGSRWGIDVAAAPARPTAAQGACDGTPTGGRSGRERVPAGTVAPLLRLAAGALVAVLHLSGTAWAGDPEEFWPELNLYTRLDDWQRLYFVAAYAQGKESDLLTLDLAAYYDLTIEPLERLVVLKGKERWRADQDWRKRKYAWVRVGYDHVFKTEAGDKSTPEDRGIVAFHARAYLPDDFLLEMRARADLRWIGGEYSSRYRLRGELNRDFNLLGCTTNVFLQAEAFYDTRYDAWSRALYQLGGEVTLTSHFRLEPSLARQIDHHPENTGLWAFAVVARWYY
jgi:hypothetical protein